MEEAEAGQAPSGAESEFEGLMRRMDQGSPEAYFQFVRTYGPHIHRAVRRKLRPALRAKFDSDDFTQEVWQSFFSAPNWESHCDSPQHLIAYLVGVAEKQLALIARAEFGTHKRNLRREQSLGSLTAAEEVPAHEPDPIDVAEMHETLEGLLRTPHRRVIWLRYLGESCAAIAAKLHIHDRRVRKILKRLDPRKNR